MNQARTSIFTSAAVALTALAVVLGSHTRERLDLGGAEAGGQVLNTGISVTGYEASNQKIPEGDYFREMVRLLKVNYVEPITDDQKLAIGAVKGMVDSLKDPHSMFMNPEEFKAYNDSIAGKFQGIGVNLGFQMDAGTGAKKATDPSTMDPSDMASLNLPRLVVISVTPGSPAEQAGVKPGDIVDSVEDHWVLGPQPIIDYRKAQLEASDKETKGLPPDEIAKRRAAAREIGVELQAKLKTMIMPLKAKDMLELGDSGNVKVTWDRAGALLNTELAKHDSSEPIVDEEGSAITLRFAPTSPQELKREVSGKQDVTLDLRNVTLGDFGSMVRCLAVVAPSGDYGEIYSDKPGKSRRLTVASGNAKPPKITILVDRTTRGPAEIFAEALASHHFAHMSGKPAGDDTVVEEVSLPDGSGYTLATGVYKPFVSRDEKKVAMRPQHRRAPIIIGYADGSVVAMGKGKGGSA